MIEQQLWGNVACQIHPQSYLQFACFEQDCKQNTLCETCVVEHQHRQQMMTLKSLPEKLQVLEIDQLCQTALQNYNLNKKKQLFNYEQLIKNFKIGFDDLQAKENTEFQKNMNEILKLKNAPRNCGYTEIFNYVKTLQNLIIKNQDHSLRLREIKLLTNESLDSLREMIELQCKNYFESQIQQPKQKPKITFLNEQLKPVAPSQVFQKPSQLSHSKTVSNFQISQPEKLSNQLPQTTRIISTNLAIQRPVFLTSNDSKPIQFIFQNTNPDVEILENGKKALQQEKSQINKYDRIVYLSPNLNLVNEVKVAFQHFKTGFSAFPIKFGVHVCDVGTTEYPKFLSKLDENEIFYLFSEKSDNESKILELIFDKIRMTLKLSLSQKHNEIIEIQEQQNRQFVFCFVLQPGSTIKLVI